MKKFFGFIFTLAIGFAGVGLMYISVNQYIVEGKDLNDYGIPTKAVVIDLEVVKENELVHGSNDRYRQTEYITPVLSYQINNEMVTDTARQFTVMVTDGQQSMGSSMLITGDTVDLIVNPEIAGHYLVAGDSDPTNSVGFAIWGTVSLLLMYWFYRRFKRLFPKETDTRMI